MSGICGFVNSDPVETVDRPMLGRMMDIMRHRGPDGEGFHLERGIGMGVRRLNLMEPKIIDQPVSSEDGSIIVICDGEIYNSVEIRHLRKMRPTVFWAYPTVLRALLHQTDCGIMNIINPRILITSAECIDDILKDRIRSIWNDIEVFGLYGTAEVGQIALECPAQLKMDFTRFRAYPSGIKDCLA
jgi:hypothetical protein